jgi:putative SOS response-associated peptidase YedK
MCGRFRLSRREQFLRDHYGIDDDVEWSPRYNIAPTQPVATVRQRSKDGKRTFSNMRWGLIPSWASDISIGASMINARAETAAAKPAFSEPLRRQRCLIPADGFYEWQRMRAARQPFCFTVGEDEAFAFAGLWDAWTDSQGRKLETCSILTTTANEVLSDIHDRMPVILPPDAYGQWLDPGFSNVGALSKLLKPYDAARMRKFAVSTRVNSVTNEDEGVCEPVAGGGEDPQMSMWG